MALAWTQAQWCQKCKKGIGKILRECARTSATLVPVDSVMISSTRVPDQTREKSPESPDVTFGSSKRTCLTAVTCLKTILSLVMTSTRKCRTTTSGCASRCAKLSNNTRASLTASEASDLGTIKIHSFTFYI